MKRLMKIPYTNWKSSRPTELALYSSVLNSTRGLRLILWGENRLQLGDLNTLGSVALMEITLGIRIRKAIVG